MLDDKIGIYLAVAVWQSVSILINNTTEQGG